MHTPTRLLIGHYNICPIGCQVVLDTSDGYVYGPQDHVHKIYQLIGAINVPVNERVSADSDMLHALILKHKILATRVGKQYT